MRERVKERERERSIIKITKQNMAFLYNKNIKCFVVLCYLLPFVLSRIKKEKTNVRARRREDREMTNKGRKMEKRVKWI